MALHTFQMASYKVSTRVPSVAPKYRGARLICNALHPGSRNLRLPVNSVAIRDSSYSPNYNNPTYNPQSYGTQEQEGQAVPVARGSPLEPAPTVFEKFVSKAFNLGSPGNRTDWVEIEGCWVLPPPEGRVPEAVVHFLGGAYVGAAPQLCYKLFLEALASRNILIIATPYSTGFDLLKVADESQFQFDRCVRALANDIPARVPFYGLGHSMGCVIHLLISSRYTVQRTGNVLMAYNNRSATEVFPLLSPMVAPSIRMMNPLLTPLASSPLRGTAESMMESMRSVTPAPMKQAAAFMEQMGPIYVEIAQGRQEFSPTPEEAKNLIRSYYGVTRNLLVRFKGDPVDESMELVSMLQGSTSISNSLDLVYRTLSGLPIRPMLQNVMDVHPDVARVANQAVHAYGELISRSAVVASQMGVANTAPIDELGSTISNFASSFGGHVGGPVTDNVQELADEVAVFMGVSPVVARGTRALPTAAVAYAQ